MRSKVVRMLALAMVLCGVGTIAAQQPGSPPKQKQKAAPEKSKLEEMLAEALKNNPDIRVAAAKLAEAEAELNRTRVQVTQKVVALHAAIASKKAEVAYREKQFGRYQALRVQGTIDAKLVDEAEDKLALTKAQLEELEAQLPGLLGKSARVEAGAGAHDTFVIQNTALRSLARLTNSEFVYPVDQLVVVAEWERRHKATGPMAERLRKALQTPVKVDYKDMNLKEILDYLANRVEGASFRVVHVHGDNKISLSFKEALPLSAVLQALADEYGCCFYVREYGILGTNPNEAPPGAMKVEEFLRQKPADESRHPSSSGKNPPENNVEGLVKSVDASGFLTISAGSDAGLAKGHTLELFRLNPQSPKQSKYLGTIRILEVEAKESIAQAVGRLADTPKAGDRAASHILRK